MKEVLNEELFRIQEIMGIKKTSINENFQTEQNNLMSEQFLPLLRGVSTAGKFERTGISAVDDVVRTQTDMLSRVKGSKIKPGGYNTLDELSQAIAKKEIPSDIAEDIAETIMKKIIVTPEGSKIVGKVWFESNTPKAIQKVVSKIKKGESLPPNLAIKSYKDYEDIISQISTGSNDIDTALKTSLENAYGVPLRTAKTEGEKAIAVAKQLDDDFAALRRDVINEIGKDPDLATKNLANWFKKYDDEAMNKLKTLGDYDARKFLLENLQRPSFWSSVSKKFSADSGVVKFLKRLFSLKGGPIWVVRAAVIAGVIAIVLYVYDNIGEIKDSVGEDKSYIKLKKIFPIAEDASEKILNSFISDYSGDDLNMLLQRKEGYRLSYKNYNNEALGEMEELTIETPSKTYKYTLQKDTDSVTSEIIPKEGTIINPPEGSKEVTPITDDEKKKVLEKLGGSNAGYGTADYPYVKKTGEKTFTYQPEVGDIINVTLD